MSWSIGRCWHGPLWLMLTGAVLVMAPMAHAQVTLAPGTTNYTYQVTTEQFSPGATTPDAMRTITTTTSQIENFAANVANNAVNNLVTTGSVGVQPTPSATNFTYQITIERFTPGATTPDAVRTITVTTSQLQTLGAGLTTFAVSQLLGKSTASATAASVPKPSVHQASATAAAGAKAAHAAAHGR